MLEAVFDDSFSVSDSKASKEEREELDSYVGEPILRWSDVDMLARTLVESDVSDDCGDYEDLVVEVTQVLQ